jgi:ABC-type uncharacterized transport system permease subunit
MRYARGFGRFWWDFVVGDEWRIAAGVLVVLALGALAARADALPDWSIAIGVALGLAAVAVGSIVLPARRAARSG